MTFKVIQARYWKWHKSIGYFLLVVCSNNVSILHHFLDTTTFTVCVTVSSDVLGGIRGYTAYTNLRGFFDSVYSPQ